MDRTGFSSARRRSSITREGLSRLEAELKRLWTVERPRVTREVAAAAAQGDRSENAEYIYGKRRLREIDRRIRYLSQRIESVQVIDPTAGPTDRVRFGAFVTVLDEDDNEARYQLVGPDETEPELGRISTDSPIGKVLLGHREGDEVTVRRPKGTILLEIIKIEY